MVAMPRGIIYNFSHDGAFILDMDTAAVLALLYAVAAGRRKRGRHHA